MTNQIPKQTKAAKTAPKYPDTPFQTAVAEYKRIKEALMTPKLHAPIPIDRQWKLPPSK